MHFVAIVKLNSSTDKAWKQIPKKFYILNGNEFRLYKSHFICKEVINLLPLIDHPDIVVESFRLGVLDKFLRSPVSE